MASSLAEQLQRVQLAQGGAPAARKFRGKPSLLWDFQRAADVDLQTIHEIGCQGAPRASTAALPIRVEDGDRSDRARPALPAPGHH